MNINELRQNIDKLREKSGLSPISDVDFLYKLTDMELKKKIKVENGEIKPVKEKEN